VKRIIVEIEGTSPLLMHSCENMMQQSATKNPAKNYDPKIEAENVAYRNKSGDLIVPGRCLKACILNAASWYKFGKKSAKQIIAGCTRIEPYEIVLTNKKGKALKKYEIDLRPVVVQRSRIIRSRPRLDEWQLKFDLIYNDDIIGDVKILQSIIEEAGQRIGILDNRPQKYGENGTFELISFKTSGNL
jgi:hypothetical protein